MAAAKKKPKVAPASGTDRSKANRLRKRAAAAERGEGKPLSATDRAFLERWERDHGAPHLRTTNRLEAAARREALDVELERKPASRAESAFNEAWGPIARAEDPRARPSSSSSSSAPKLEHVDEPDDDDDDDESGEHAIPHPEKPAAPPPSSGAPQGVQLATTPQHGGECPGGPECRGCRKKLGLQTCISTGERIYPKLSENASKGFAGFALVGMMYGASFVRADRARIEPSAFEHEEMAKALRDVADEYFPQLSIMGSLLAFGYVTAAVGGRMLRDPMPADQRRALQQQQQQQQQRSQQQQQQQSSPAPSSAANGRPDAPAE